MDRASHWEKVTSMIVIDRFKSTHYAQIALITHWIFERSVTIYGKHLNILETLLCSGGAACLQFARPLKVRAP